MLEVTPSYKKECEHVLHRKLDYRMKYRLKKKVEQVAEIISKTRLLIDVFVVV